VTQPTSGTQLNQVKALQGAPLNVGDDMELSPLFWSDLERNGAFFRPWVGENYHNTRLLILSESAYSWIGKDGEVVRPSASHPKAQLLDKMENFHENRFYRAMGRVLCGKMSPTYDELITAWNDYAYTIFVQNPLGLSARSRPTAKQFKDAFPHFLRLLERIRPSKVVVAGKLMWNSHFPSCTGPHLNDCLQAYKLSDGALVWCFAIPHPSNRTEGFRWREVGESIRQFKSAELPRR
jgi:hypothetical protein